jgi:hypothetical protein
MCNVYVHVCMFIVMLVLYVQYSMLYVCLYYCMETPPLMGRCQYQQIALTSEQTKITPNVLCKKYSCKTKDLSKNYFALSSTKIL